MATTKVTFAFPDNAWPGIVDSLCARRNRPETVNVDGKSVDNPETKEQFAIRSVMDYVAGEWKEYSKELALKEAKQAVQDAANEREIAVKAATETTVETV